MNPRGAWRDLWLVLTILALCIAMASAVPVGLELLRDPYGFASTLTDFRWLRSGWPPGSPSAAQIGAALPFVAGYLAWRFHRFYQQSLQPPPEDEGPV